MWAVRVCAVYPWSVQLMLVTLSHYDLSPPHFSEENTNTISNLSSGSLTLGDKRNNNGKQSNKMKSKLFVTGVDFIK